MRYQSASAISLKSHPDYNEKWLQERIKENPQVLGLGDLLLRGDEVVQRGAGRLDLLLVDPESDTRYEVEIQLGSTDPSHIIRTIEYWDIERRRYPQFDHVAVLVAEDITSRFLNVVGLFNGFIPLIAIQLRAYRIDDVLTLVGTVIMDRRTPAGEEDVDGAPSITDRAYWEKRSSVGTMKAVDELLQVVREVTTLSDLQLKYNKAYIGVTRDGLTDNFVSFRPRKKHVVMGFRLAPTDSLRALLEDAGLEVMSTGRRMNRLRVSLPLSEFKTYEALIGDLARQAFSSDTPEEAVDPN